MFYFAVTYDYSDNQLSVSTINKNLFPAEAFGFNSLLIYFGLQWYSTQLYDGGGPEMARYTAVKNRRAALFAGLFPVLISILTRILLIIMVIKIISLGYGNAEIDFLFGLKAVFPKPLEGFIVLAYFIVFIAASEAVINWGAGMVCSGANKKLEENKISKIHYQIFSISIMAFIALFGGILAIFVNNLSELFALVLSAGAGVSIVFVLRWFWLRINAWSQLAAMISSVFYTFILRFFWIEEQQNWAANLNLYLSDFRFVLVLTLTIVTWISVTFLTPKDDYNTLKTFKDILPNKRVILKRFSLALLIGIGIYAFQVLVIRLLL